MSVGALTRNRTAGVPRASRTLAAALAMAALVPMAAASADRAWSEVRSGDTTIMAADDVDILTIAADVRSVQAVFDQSFEPADTRRLEPVTLLAVRDERGIREVLPHLWEHRGPRPVGGYWHGPFGHHIVVRTDASQGERVRRLLHEYAHFVTHQRLGEVPPWIDEGLAELWTTARVSGTAVEIGVPSARRLKALRNERAWVPAGALMAMTALPPASESRALDMFYAQSWALVHYLTVGQVGGLKAAPVSADSMGPVAVAQATMADLVGHLRVASRMSGSELDAQLQAYLRAGQFQSIQIPIAPASGAGTSDMRPITRVEALLRRSRMIADGPRPALALPLLEEARALDPGNPEVAETIGVVRFLGNDMAAAAAVFDGLIAAGTASHLAYYYRAVLAEAAPERGDGSGPVPVEAYLRRTLDMKPGFQPALERLSEIDHRR